MSEAIEDRKSLIVYVYSTKQVRQLKKYGLIYYVSQKMHYVVMYVNADNYALVKEKISSLRIVKKVEETPYEQIANELAVSNDFDEVDDDEDY